MISTSVISGTGLKKCSPVKRSGRSLAAASRVIEIDEVLVASSAVGLQGQPGEDLALHRFILGRRFDDQIGIGKGGIVGGQADPRQRRIGIGLADNALADAAPRFLAIVARAASARAMSISDRMTS